MTSRAKSSIARSDSISAAEQKPNWDTRTRNTFAPGPCLRTPTASRPPTISSGFRKILIHSSITLETMPRDVQLVVFPSQSSSPNNSQALPHWALLIPEEGSTTKGKVIHVVETPSHDFALEFRRNYDVAATKKQHHVFLLARVHSRYVRDAPAGDGAMIEADAVPRDVLEQEAKRIEPGSKEAASLAHARDGAAAGLGGGPLSGQENNCQDWVRGYVECLVRKGIFSKSAIQVLDHAKALEGSATSKF